MFKFFPVLTAVFLVSFPTLPARALASEQPYIDSLISELPKDPHAGTAENPDPYIQSIKKTIKQTPSEDSTGYSDELRKQIPTKDGSEGYSEKLGKGLPPDRGSAIEDYRKGKKLKANKGSLETRSAFGFKLFASAKRTYSAGAKQDVAYDTVYGAGWIPDFAVHYEWRPFTGSLIKKFGLYTSVGASFTKANGKLDYDGPFGTDSRTEFKFITIPFNVGLIYRMNFGDIIYPYFAGGPSAIGFIEQRNDKAKGNRGYDLGYWFSGGAAFGLDWISPRNSWEQYETTGAKHSYLTVDYTRLESVAGGLVEFTVDGVEVGFTFEL